MTDHIIKAGAYAELYGAPDPVTDRVAWDLWITENRYSPHHGPTPRDYHTDDCPGCAESDR